MAVVIREQRDAASPRITPLRAPVERRWLGGLGVATFIAILTSTFVTTPVTLAATGIVLLLAGLGLALGAWVTSQPRDHDAATAWDMAALLVFLGFATIIVGGAPAFLP